LGRYINKDFSILINRLTKMGIPKYFRYIINNYNELLQVVPNNIIKPQHLYLDMNCIIHPSIQFIINEYPSLVKEYNDLEENDKKFHMDPKLVTEFENKFYDYLAVQLNNVINSVKPTKTVYLAIDGVAPRAKMEQQRTRRYRSFKEYSLKSNIMLSYGKNSEIWDRNAITPGTIFMYKLCLWLKKVYLKELKKNMKGVKLVLDDVSVLGEGEHKIFDWMRKNVDNDIHCIYGLDADLIMLSLCSPMNIYLLRETPTFKSEIIKSDYCYFDVCKLKDMIISYFINLLKIECNDIDDIDKLNDDVNRKLILYNYVFLCFLFGNDFLPKFVGFDLNNDTIEYIIKKYVHQFSIIKKHIVDENGYLNPFATRQLFLSLYGDEEVRIVSYFKNTINKLLHYRIPTKVDNYENEILNIDYFPCKEHNKNVSIYDSFKDNNILHNWMDSYYKYYFNIISINKNKTYIYNLCNNYLEGLQWVTSYYINGCPSYKWYYMYRATPCMRELCNFLKDRFHYPEFEKGNYTPLEQLAMVIPIQSKRLLPIGYVNEMDGSILKKWYPNNFRLDTLFKIQLHECNPILMNINDNEVIDVYKKLENNKKLSRFDKLRNNIGEIYII
jgi:5'-3' exoribonuclease 2